MNRNPLQNPLTLALSAFMGVAYLGGGLYLVASSNNFSGYIPALNPGPMRTVFGILLMAYGVFRLYRAYSSRKTDV